MAAFLAAGAAGCFACTRPQGDAKKSETRLALARDFLQRNELEAAETEAGKAIAYLPTNDEAYNVRGLVHFLRGMGSFRLVEIDDCLTGLDAEALRTDMDAHFAKAEADFRRAVELAPDYGEAWSNRGVVANLLGEHDRAAEHLIQALSHPARLVNPGLSRAHLGWAYFHQADHVAAAKELRQALQLPLALRLLGHRRLRPLHDAGRRRPGERVAAVGEPGRPRRDRAPAGRDLRARPRRRRRPRPHHLTDRRGRREPTA